LLLSSFSQSGCNCLAAVGVAMSGSRQKLEKPNMSAVEQ